MQLHLTILFPLSPHTHLNPFKPVKNMNINDILLSENLLNSFRRLEAKDVVKATAVCKLWWELIDENKACWRVLVLSEKGKSLEKIQEVVNQFDEKSGSTLQKVSFLVKDAAAQDFNQLTSKITVPKQTFQTLHIAFKSI